jgi:fumarylpyruvate hydrolase
MKYTISSAEITSLAIARLSERHPVARFFFEVRNHAAHACEMGKYPDHDPPFFFMKPSDPAVDASGPATIPYLQLEQPT